MPERYQVPAISVLLYVAMVLTMYSHPSTETETTFWIIFGARMLALLLIVAAVTLIQKWWSRP